LDEFAGGRLVSPSAERNKSPIAEVLKRVLPGHGVVLEVSSGTGQHVVHFAREMPHLTWQPSERDEASFQSITHWVAAEALPNIRAPLRLDVADQPWLVGSAGAGVCLHMIHIAPWSAAEALIRGAGAAVMARIAGTVSTHRRATRFSMSSCVRKIRNGVCAILK